MQLAAIVLDLGQAKDAIIAVAAVLAALGVIINRASKWFGAAVGLAMNEELKEIRGELKTNGGGSVKDIAIATNKSVCELSKSVTDMHKFSEKAWAHQRQQNREMLSRQAATIAFIELVHDDELDTYGDDIIPRFERLAEMELSASEDET